MKNFTKIIIGIIAFMSINNYSDAQYTYQTAKRLISSNSDSTQSNSIVQPGIATGCALVNTQPYWAFFGFCESGLVTHDLTYQRRIFNSSTDTISVVIFGPFSDTLDMGSKLTVANIDSCYNIITSNQQTFSLYSNYNYTRGSIFYYLITSSENVGHIHLSKVGTGIYDIDYDTLMCRICHSQLSDLNQSICFVTYDSLTQKNKILWEKDIYTPTMNYVLFRKNLSNQLDTIAIQSVNNLSEIIDSTSNPLVKTYTYQMAAMDSCGNYYVGNSYPNHVYNLLRATTVHLISYPSGNNAASLVWNAYQPGINFTFYYIYRTGNSGIKTLIDSIAGSAMTQTYTDINAPVGINTYQIGIPLIDPCNVSLLPTYSIILSNPSQVSVTGINKLTDLSSAITVQPNPFNNFTKVDLHLLSKQNSKIVLRNVTGQIILQFDDVKTNELIINKNNLAQGLYFLEVTANNFYARKKIVINN